MFALSFGSDHLYFRSDVSSSELSGKEWKNLDIGRAITDSMSSLSSDSSHQETEGTTGELRLNSSSVLARSTCSSTLHCTYLITSGTVNLAVGKRLELPTAYKFFLHCLNLNIQNTG